MQCMDETDSGLKLVKMYAVKGNFSLVHVLLVLLCTIRLVVTLSTVFGTSHSTTVESEYLENDSFGSHLLHNTFIFLIPTKLGKITRHTCHSSWEPNTFPVLLNIPSPVLCVFHLMSDLMWCRYLVLLLITAGRR